MISLHLGISLVPSTLGLAWSSGPFVVLRQQPEEESLNLQCTKNNLPKQHKYQTQRRVHEKQRLMRFGLDAYVLGAMKERFN